ncbi:MAG: ABC transporter ATP-binding protein [Ignavibacteria bacterium]|nr:ABC transporter ATP-binding protein [Ignavibacteria bacterium]
MTGITKIFGEGFKANDNVNLRVKRGDIHALVGENGAGKSTLMNILYGMYRPDSGYIKINSAEKTFHSPSEAISGGIGMVHQHFMLVETLSVLENIILGDEPAGFTGLIDYNTCRKKIKKLIESFQIDIDLDAKVGSLPVGTQQKIEILKILYRNAEILILDEPTAVLTPREAESLFKTLKELRSEGKTIILISHKMSEVLSISDRITVLRRGEVTGDLHTADTGKSELGRLIVGEEIGDLSVKEKTPFEDTILEVKNVSIKNDRKFLAIEDISFLVQSGEILGIAGVEGNGQTELIEALSGIREIDSGTVLLNGKRLQQNDVIAHIPADRHKHGIVKEYPLYMNILLGRESDSGFSTPYHLKQKELINYTDNLIKEFDIRPADHGQLMGGLSGGNQQKAVAARELTKDTDLIIASHPTRGLDIKAAKFVHEALLSERKKGKAVVLVSTDLSELLMLSDRILVMYNGTITGMFEAVQTDENEIGMYMMGMISKDSKK